MRAWKIHRSSGSSTHTPKTEGQKEQLLAEEDSPRPPSSGSSETRENVFWLLGTLDSFRNSKSNKDNAP